MITNLSKNFEVTDVPGLLKDPKTNVIINTNFGEFERVKAARRRNKEAMEQAQEHREKFQHLEHSVNALSKSVSELANTQSRILIMLFELIEEKRKK